VNERTEAVLLTGLFGVGKSTVAADMANLLETSGTTYAALDLDWLTWTNAGGPTRADEHRIMLINLAAIVRNYADVGVTRFVLARSIRDRHEQETIAATIAMPLRTVELTLPYHELARRLATDPTDE
jgi:adenylylsulfate kinase-like enzyme